MNAPSPNNNCSRFSSRLAAVPYKPGVYLLKDSSGALLYVGKASLLRTRLRSYFQKQTLLAPKTKHLIKLISDFEYIVTESEQEALLLENSLIKQHLPRFNARLKDDKTYPYIKVDLREAFPQIYVTRRVCNDGARYFGPFASAGSVRKTLNLIKRLFPYRSCAKDITGTDSRPCLDFHINRCVGPCIGAVDRQDYRLVIQQVIRFLEGDTNIVVKDLKKAMIHASHSLNYERAAVLRDQVRAIEKVQQAQKVVSPDKQNVDVIAVAVGQKEAWVEVFFIRKGNLIGRDNFIMEGTRYTLSEEILGHFLMQFYSSNSYIPRRILLEKNPEDSGLIESMLARKRNGPVSFVVPKRGAKRRLVKMVVENAVYGFEQLNLKRMSNTDLMTRAMTELQEHLSLAHLPKRIECFDVSHIQGTNTVASMTVFESGVAKRSDYRRFKIKSVTGNDDYASISEVLTRRFQRLKNSPKEGDASGFGVTPDLVLIDGGKGQLFAALQTFLHLGVRGVALASIAKKHEEIFLPDVPEAIVLPKDSQALFLVQRARDEAHRFAITYHRNLRSKKAFISDLDLVPGIGPKRKLSLIRHFGSLKAIEAAGLQELAAAPGMTQKLAIAVKEHL